MQRMGMMIGLRPEKIAEYRTLHTAVWPDVLARISASHIRNDTIFLREPENILFGTWEYHGSDFAALRRAGRCCHLREFLEPAPADPRQD
jgi:L-rhamnose mutarotase